MNEEETAPQPPDPTARPDSPAAAMAPEISRRVSAILDAVEREASRLREEAQTEANRYTENAHRHADGLVADRLRRISELSDELIVKSEAVVARLDDAAPVRQGFENLVRALGDAAERLSNESEATRGNFAPPSFHEAAWQPPPQAPTSPDYQPASGPLPQQPYPGPPPAVPAAQQQPAVPRPHFQPEQPSPVQAPSQPPWQPPVAPNPALPASWRELDDARMIAIQLAGTGNTRADVRGHLHRALGIVDAEPTLDEIFGRGTGEDARVPWTTGHR
jgi:hypothetical protein